MRRRLVAPLFVTASLLIAPGTLQAQDPGRGRVEVSGGAVLIGPINFGTVAANETANDGGMRALFLSDTTLDASIGATGSIGVRLSTQFRAEFTAAYSPTSLSTRITSDAEGIADVTADAPVTQFLFEGGLLVQPPRWRRGHISPFLTAGIGYLRQLNDGRTLVEDGEAYYFGGGLYYERWTSGRRRLKASGLRLDVRGQIFEDGVSPDDTRRLTPSVAAAFFARF